MGEASASSVRAGATHDGIRRAFRDKIRRATISAARPTEQFTQIDTYDTGGERERFTEVVLASQAVDVNASHGVM